MLNLMMLINTCPPPLLIPVQIGRELYEQSQAARVMLYVMSPKMSSFDPLMARVTARYSKGIDDSVSFSQFVRAICHTICQSYNLSV